MIDLGKHAGTVLSAYGATFALLGVLLFVSLQRSKAAKSRLEKLEKDRRD